MYISLSSCRVLLLHLQGLLTPPARTVRKADVLGVIRRMGALQIDTIHIVARSPYLVLYSRLGDYRPQWLDELHAAGKLFEYWAHAMCWLPSEDWPLFASLIEHGRREGFKNWTWAQDWLDQHRELAEHVLARIRAEGGLRSADFENRGERGPWWDWKGEKAALECLFLLGELVIARRDRFQRVYDLRARVQPSRDEGAVLPYAEVQQRLLEKAARALGVATLPWLRDYYRQRLSDAREAAAALVAAGTLLPATIEGVKEGAFIHRDLVPLLKKAEAGKLQATYTALLSPFDPLVWDRRRASALFGFDYTIEVYTPGHKRQYGYFTLPILHRGALIGRLDPKAHRKEGVFEIKALHLEPGCRLTAEAAQEVADAITHLAAWHATPQLRLGVCEAGAKAVFRCLRAGSRTRRRPA